MTAATNPLVAEVLALADTLANVDDGHEYAGARAKLESRLTELLAQREGAHFTKAQVLKAVADREEQVKAELAPVVLKIFNAATGQKLTMEQFSKELEASLVAKGLEASL